MICTMQLIIWRVFQKKVSNRIFRALLACRLFRRNSKPFTNVKYNERSNAFINSSLKQVNDVSFFFVLGNLSLDLFVCITFGTSGGKSQSLCIYVYFSKSPPYNVCKVKAYYYYYTNFTSYLSIIQSLGFSGRTNK